MEKFDGIQLSDGEEEGGSKSLLWLLLVYYLCSSLIHRGHFPNTLWRFLEEKENRDRGGGGE